MWLSPSLSNRKLQLRDRMGSLQTLCSLQKWAAKVVVMAVKLVIAAKVERQIREKIWMIGKRMICRSALFAKGEAISPRTAWASNVAILQKLPTLQQNHRLRLLRHSPLRLRSIGWRLTQVLHPVIGSSIADARLTSLDVDLCSLPIPNILQQCRRWRD